MSVKENISFILNELNDNSRFVNNQDLLDLINEILDANHIFLSGKGRSGLVISAFANRLMHLGLSISLVGEISSPHAKKGDLFIIGSGSGETESLVSLANVAKSVGMKIALITTAPGSSLAKLADIVVVLPGASKCLGKSIQPMASAFEQLSFVVYDAIVLELMKKMNQNTNSMYQRHANLE